MITQVNSKIDRGGYTTNLTAIWESAGGSLAAPSTDVQDAGTCDEVRVEARSILRAQVDANTPITTVPVSDTAEDLAQRGLGVLDPEREMEDFGVLDY